MQLAVFDRDRDYQTSEEHDVRFFHVALGSLAAVQDPHGGEEDEGDHGGGRQREAFEDPVARHHADDVETSKCGFVVYEENWKEN